MLLHLPKERSTVSGRFPWTLCTWPIAVVIITFSAANGLTRSAGMNLLQCIIIFDASWMVWGVLFAIWVAKGHPLPGEKGPFIFGIKLSNFTLSWYGMILLWISSGSLAFGISALSGRIIVEIGFPLLSVISK